jgi:choline kinase/phosphatidylglycerophosphate synthase
MSDQTPPIGENLPGELDGGELSAAGAGDPAALPRETEPGLTAEGLRVGPVHALPRQAVILAAGMGERMAEASGTPKVLTVVGGISLLERHNRILRRLGIEDIVVVVGHRAADVIEHARRRNLDVRFVESSDYLRGSAASLLAAAGEVGDRFLVIMGDHAYAEEAIARVLQEPGDFLVAVDSTPHHADIEASVKARLLSGLVVDSGVELDPWDGIDAGVSVCTPDVFASAEQTLESGPADWEDVKHRHAARRGPAVAVDLWGANWFDIDTLDDLKRTEEALLGTTRSLVDGWVSRHLLRHISKHITRRLARLPITPNQVSFAVLLLSLLAGGVLAAAGPWGWPALVAGGLLVFLVVLLDLCDGELARLKVMTSSYGAFYDAVLDRWGDAALVLGLTIGAEADAWVWIVAFLTLTGTFQVPYSRARYEASFGGNPPTEFTAWTVTRDARLAIIAAVACLSALLPLQVPLLIALAVMSNVEVARRVIDARPRAA